MIKLIYSVFKFALFLLSVYAFVFFAWVMMMLSCTDKYQNAVCQDNVLSHFMIWSVSPIYAQ